MGFVVFFASRFLYLSVTKDLSDQLTPEEMKEAEDLKPVELKDLNMNE